MNKICLIDHVACAGGTLFSKCIASQPKTIFLSEIYPYTMEFIKGQFRPSDLIYHLYSCVVPPSDELITKILIDSLNNIVEYYTRLNINVVIRGHAHSRFFVNKNIIQNKPILKNVLKNNFNLYSVATVRDPIDSFLSARIKNWVEDDFDSYCSKYLAFISCYDKFYKYEDLVRDPEYIISQICKDLDIKFDIKFIDNFGKIILSGDSGRKNIDVIRQHTRRPYSEKFQSDVQNSKNYCKLIEKLGYSCLY